MFSPNSRAWIGHSVHASPLYVNSTMTMGPTKCEPKCIARSCEPEPTLATPQHSSKSGNDLIRNQSKKLNQ